MTKKQYMAAFEIGHMLVMSRNFETHIQCQIDTVYIRFMLNICTNTVYYNIMQTWFPSFHPPLPPLPPTPLLFYFPFSVLPSSLFLLFSYLLVHFKRLQHFLGILTKRPSNSTKIAFHIGHINGARFLEIKQQTILKIMSYTKIPESIQKIMQYIIYIYSIYLFIV